MQIGVADAAVKDFNNELGGSWLSAIEIKWSKWQLRVKGGITFGCGHE